MIVTMIPKCNGVHKEGTGTSASIRIGGGVGSSNGSLSLNRRRPFKNELEMCVDDLDNQVQCHSLGCHKFIAIRQ